ncbi:hypothetical protein MMPV_004520 [Pyropia vietnamensis]
MASRGRGVAALRAAGTTNPHPCGTLASWTARPPPPPPPPSLPPTTTPAAALTAALTAHAATAAAAAAAAAAARDAAAAIDAAARPVALTLGTLHTPAGADAAATAAAAAAGLPRLGAALAAARGAGGGGGGGVVGAVRDAVGYALLVGVAGWTGRAAGGSGGGDASGGGEASGGGLASIGAVRAALGVDAGVVDELVPGEAAAADGAPPPPAPSVVITPDDYLWGVVGLVGVLSRLCVTRVAVGDMAFVGRAAGLAADIFAVLRSVEMPGGAGGDAFVRRVDGLRGDVQKMEDVVYDLSIRGMMPRGGGGG